MNEAFEIIEGDVVVRDGRIAAIGASGAVPADRVIDARGAYLLPGFIQTHIHLCQTLFRGYADDLALLDWLKTRVWPMEAAHTPTVLTMETVHDTDAVFEALEPMGLRAVVGKCMMDADDAVPAAACALPSRLGLPCRAPGNCSRRLAGSPSNTTSSSIPTRRKTATRSR